MKTKIIIISSIILILILSSIFVVNYRNSVKATLSCGDKDTGCVYIKENYKEKKEIKFTRSDVMQCTVTTVQRGSMDIESKKNLFELMIMLHSKNENFLVRHYSHKKLSDVCQHIFDGETFSITVKMKNK